jgi:GntR family transcriptional repressor for pyruvate dehydrogenase complex
MLDHVECGGCAVKLGSETGRTPSVVPGTANRIREKILAGDYPPGTTLPPERVLAEQLGVSRGSVREAISQLSALNVVQARRGAGTFVSGLNADSLLAPLEFALQVDPNMLLHLYELRRILEPAAAGLAAARISPDGVDRLQRLVGEYADGVPSGQLDHLKELDETIHRTIAVEAGNPLLTAILHSLSASVRRARQITSALPTTPAANREELTSLVDAVAQGDPLRSEAAMNRHIARLEADARRTIGQTAANSDGQIRRSR